MRVACWIPKAINTNSEYAILTAFSLQRWLRECASVLSYTYIACLVDTWVWHFRLSVWSQRLGFSSADCLCFWVRLDDQNTFASFCRIICWQAVYDREKENWRILTNKEIYASVKKPPIIETIRLNRLRWFGHVQRMEENRVPKRVLNRNLGTTRLRGRPRNRWQDESREHGRIGGGKGWQEKVHDIEEW